MLGRASTQLSRSPGYAASGHQRRTVVTRAVRSGRRKAAAGHSFSIGDLLNKESTTSEGHELQVDGFVQSLRKQSKIAFASIRDGSSLQPLQAVLKPQDAQDLSIGSAVSLHGTWKKCPPGAKQSHELQATAVKAINVNDIENDPIQNKYQSPQYLRSLPHLRARIPSNSLMLRLRSHASRAFNSYFFEHGFYECHTPVITSSDCEGAGEVFTVAPAASSSGSTAEQADGTTHGEQHYFKSPKYLTVSGQLHLEALAQAMGNVWTLSPTFRAEKSDTARHLSEFYMLEAEITFVNELDIVMDLVESSIRNAAEQCTNGIIGRELLEHAASVAAAPEHGDGPSIGPEKLQGRWDGLRKSYWPRITYERAFDVLEEAVQEGNVAFELKPDRKGGLQAEHERYLAEKIGQGSPIFVTDYPREQKPFYMLPTPGSDGSTVACFDLLMPEVGEVAGGSLREHRLQPLEAAMRDKGLLKDGEASKLDWYLDLRRYGSVPHGGYGMGFDRLLCYLAGVSNVRDMSTFPRWYGRCDT